MNLICSPSIELNSRARKLAIVLPNTALCRLDIPIVGNVPAFMGFPSSDIFFIPANVVLSIDRIDSWRSTGHYMSNLRPLIIRNATDKIVGTAWRWHRSSEDTEWFSIGFNYSELNPTYSLAVSGGRESRQRRDPRHTGRRGTGVN